MATFSNLVLSKFYYIIHQVWLDGCFDTLETRIPVPTPQLVNTFHTENIDDIHKRKFCLGEDVYLDGTASVGEEKYWIDIQRRPFGTNLDFTDYKVLGQGDGWFVGPVGEINLSQAYANIGYYFEPGYTYKIKLALQNIANCVAWTERVDTFTVNCCPNYFFANFQLNRIAAGAGMYKLSASGHETYANVNAQHEWTVLSSPNLDGGPYTLVDELTGPMFEILVPEGLCYFVIHKVITLCEEVCYGQSDCINAGREKELCDLCGPIDCSILDDTLCAAPTNPHVACDVFESAEFRWNAVPGVYGYVVEITFNNPACCIPKWPALLTTHTTTTNSLPLNSIPQPLWNCLRWRVASVCDTVGNLSWSEYSCFYGCKSIGGDRAEQKNQGIRQSATATIYPNPAADLVSVQFAAPFSGTIQLTDGTGRIFARHEIAEQTRFRFQLDEVPAGLYWITIQNHTERQVHKLIKK